MVGPWFRSLHLDRQGIERMLGSLESEIMEWFWQQQTGTIKAVCESLPGDRAYNTIMTVMNRLVEKGLLERHNPGKGKASTYRVVVSRRELAALLNESLADGLSDDLSQAALSSFVNRLAERDPELLERLGELAKRRLQNHEKTES